MNKKIKTRVIILALIVFTAILFNSCAGSNETSTNSKLNPVSENKVADSDNSVSDKTSELLERVLLPEMPEEVVWKESAAGNDESRPQGTADTKIIAVLRYEAAEASKLVSLIEKNRSPQTVEIGLENWFPEELTAQAQTSGSETLKGIEYGANQFYNTPYVSGRVIRVEGTNYFILELFTR